MPTFQDYTDNNITQLMTWYNSSTGLWNTTGWWNSANIITILADYSLLLSTHKFDSIIANTFAINSSGNFFDSFFDDELWWAAAWIKAYELTRISSYLSMAQTLFSDVSTNAWDATCGGGVWQQKTKTYKNAITNELFLFVAARLYALTSTASYNTWAANEWSWFQSSGMINGSNLINDGLTNPGCVNNGLTTWSYNQGVILGGLVELYRITGNASYLATAQQIATAAITNLIDGNGVLFEPGEGGVGGGDAPQFKGIFMRHLRRLVETLLSLNVRDVSLYSAYIQFAYKNANSIWNNDNSSNSFGFHWSGPVDSTDAARQSSALDAFNTALAFSLFPVNSGSFVGGFAQTAPPSRTDLGIRRSTRKTKFRRNLNQGIY